MFDCMEPYTEKLGCFWRIGKIQEKSTGNEKCGKYNHCKLREKGTEIRHLGNIRSNA